MAIIKSYSPLLNLSNFQVFENDDLPNSEYFRITELSETLTGGKNGFLIEGSVHLKETSEIKIEILDVAGNPIYFEPGDGTPEYYEGNAKLISVHVYDDASIGIGKITILGELKTYIGDDGEIKDIPNEWAGVYNVKWERSIQINKNVSNETIVRFYKRPTVQIDELVKPIFTKNIPSVTQTGTLFGISQNPPSQSDLSKWRAGTNYKLKISDDISNWTSSIDDNIISVPSLNYSARVIEVLSNKEVMVDTPFTSSGDLVNDMVVSNYTTTFEFVEGQTVTDSALTGSFAKINFNNLKTFVGDVARVKVFRKSRNTVGDFQFVQESKLESSELLKDITTTSDTELSYGRFDELNLSNYWISSSNDHPLTINSDVLNASVKVDYDATAGGIQTLSTSGSLSITEGVEYTLNLKTLLSGSEGSSQSVRAYFSGSNYTQDFLNISGSSIYNTRQSVSQNILATGTANDVYLKFDFNGGDWYVSNVSLKNAQDTSFSPDEFTLIQDIPRKLAIETFDFKFEFYDINNNYIPVDVTTTKAFTGGNDFPSSDKLFTFESDRNAFRFTSGSIGNPPFQQIQFKTRSNNLTGSATYASSAFDIGGAYIIPSEYSGTYPGTLSNVTTAGAIIKIADFSGSDASVTVGSIVYTASIEEQVEFETVYRLEDGDNAPQLIVTSNVNQFIYEPTTLSPKPSGQSATIRAQRKNLTSLTTPIEVNSGSGAPPLSAPVIDNATGINTYTIDALQYSSSFANSSFPETTYSFTGSDQFDLPFSDEITISPVINFDAVSLVLSNESTSFPAKSIGEVTSTFDSSKGNVQMFIGGTEIEHDDIGGGRLKNTFDITSIVETNVTAISTSPTDSIYGITAFPNQHDSGSLALNIEYLSGDSSTSQSFQKVVSYTKSRKAVPNVEVSVNLQSQGINANSVGSGSESPKTISVKATEGGTNRFTSIGTVVYSGGLSGTVSTNTITFSDSADDMLSDTETITIPVNFTDGEGTAGTKTIVASVSRIREAAPITTITASPQSQNVGSDYDFVSFGSPSNISVGVNQGSTDFTHTTGTVTANKFKITGVTNGTNNNNGTVTPNTPTNGSTVSGVITLSLTNSEGTAFTSKTITFSVGVASEGTPSKTTGLSFSDNSIMYDSDGTNPVPSTVTINATTTNFRNAHFKFTGGGSHFTDETSFTDGDGPNNKSTTFTAPTNYITTPLTFRVGVSEALDSSTEIESDTESIIFVKPGEDVKPTFFIRPLRGTQIKNAGRAHKVGADHLPIQTLELQVQGIDGTGSFDVSGSAQGDAQLYSGSVLLTTSLLGTSDGGNGVTYNPILNSSAINGQATYHLRKDDGTLLDTIALVDVTDGVGGGSFVAAKGKVSRRLVGSSSYEPSFLKATAVFFDTTGSEYRLSTTITPSFDHPLDSWTIASPAAGQSGNGHIVMTAADGDETNIPFDSAYASKDINVTAVFTDPGTQQKNTINETWYIISDGTDGISAKTVSLQSSGQVFIKAKDGTITPSTISVTAVKENISGSLNFSATNSITLGGSGTTRIISSSEMVDTVSTVVTATGSEDNVVFQDSVSIVRVDAGTDGLTILNTNQSHMFPADSTGSVLDFSNSGTHLSIFEGAQLLEYNPLNPSSPYQGHWKFYPINNSTPVPVVTPTGKLTLGAITDGGKHAIVAPHTAMDFDTDAVNVSYNYLGAKLNGELFSGSFQQSISKGRAGRDAIQVTNSNSSHVFPATFDGVVSSFVGGGTTLEVFEGANILKFNSGTAGNGEYGVSVSDVSGITEGAVTGNGLTVATVGVPSGMTSDSVVITYTISGKRTGGVPFSTTTTQSFSKALEGVNAKTVVLSASSNIFVKAQDGSITPSEIVLTANGQNLTNSGSFSTTAGTLSSKTEILTGGTVTVTNAHFVDAMVVSYTAVSDDGSIADSVTLRQLDEGSGNISAVLSNEAHLLQANAAGVVSSHGGSGTTIRCFEGATALPFVTGTPAKGQFTVSVGNTANITEGAASLTTGFCTIADHSSTANGTDSFVITYTISGKTLNGTSFTTFTKTQSISKSKAGVIGVNGTSAVTVDTTPVSQTIKRPIVGANVAPINISTVVIQGTTTFSYDAVSANGYDNSSFYIDNVSNCTVNAAGVVTPSTPSVGDPLTATFDVNYKDSDGVENTISKTHVTTVVLDGNTGPGIVHTGLWESGRVYQFSTSGAAGTARRDSVLFSGTYYGATRLHTSTNNNAATTGKPGTGGPWESLGTQDLFVAAKVAIFEDSFVQNTLNVGTNNNGAASVANIALVGGTANPYIAIGQSSQGWGNNGIWIGNHDNSGTPSYRMSLASAGNHMKWDGSTLEIKGSIEITAGPTADVLNQLNTATGSLASDISTAGTNAVTSGSNAASTAQSNAATDATSKANTAESNANTTAQNSTTSAGYVRGSLGVTNAATAVGLANEAQAVADAHTAQIGGLSSFTGSLGAMAAIGQINSGNSATFIGAGTIVTNQVATGLVTSGNYSFSSGNFSDAGSTFDLSTGDIITPGMRVTSSGDAFFKGTVTSGAVSTGVVISNGAQLSDGTNSKAWSTLFEIDSSEVKIKSNALVGNTRLNTRFSDYDAYDGRITTNQGSVQQVGTSFYGSSYSCVLSGTKVVTKRGEVNIEDTNLDDIIKVYNFLTGIWEWSTIKGIHNRVTDSGWSHIKTKMGYELKCSNTHAIYHPEYPNEAIKINELGVDGQLYVVKNGEIVKDYVESIKVYDEPIEVWNYHLDYIYNYISNGILSHNMAAPAKTTLGHHYVKRNNVNIEVGDLVKLDSNNELIKTTNSKDSSVVGVLWKPIEEYVTDEFYTDSDITPPSELSEIRFLDSLSNILPIDERGVKSMWNVAAIGDSRDYNITNSEHILDGFKVCNQAGDISKGDLLCSSDTAGYLMKQPSEHVVIRFEGSTPIYEERQSQCSYTVAKCMEDVTFDSEGKSEGVYGYLYCG